MDVANPNDDNPNSDPIADVDGADDSSAESQDGDMNPAGHSPDAATSSGEMADDTLDTEEIEALLQEQSATPSAPTHESHAEQLLRQAEADLAAAVAPDLSSAGNAAELLQNAEQFQFHEFGNSSESADLGIDLQSLQDVELDLRIELGRAELLIEDVLQLNEGAVVPLDKLAGDPVDILVNGRLIARGEVLVLNDNFCVRVSKSWNLTNRSPPVVNYRLRLRNDRGTLLDSTANGIANKNMLTPGKGLQWGVMWYRWL